MNDKLIIAGREFGSRLFIGTGKFPSNEVMRRAIVALHVEGNHFLRQQEVFRK